MKRRMGLGFRAIAELTGKENGTSAPGVYGGILHVKESTVAEIITSIIVRYSMQKFIQGIQAL